MYGKRQIQVENFSKQKNEQIKTAQKILMDKKLPGTQGATNLLPRAKSRGGTLVTSAYIKESTYS